MESERLPGQENVPSTREQCYLAFNYAILNPFTLSAALADGPLTVPELEQAIAREAVSDSMCGFMGMENPVELGRGFLADPGINPTVSTEQDRAELQLMLEAVDNYFDK